MNNLVTDVMMAEAVEAAGSLFVDARPGPSALASPSYQALESRSVLSKGRFIKRLHPETRDGFDVNVAMIAAGQAADVGAGPKVYWSDVEMGAIAMEALEGSWKAIRQSDLQKVDVIRSVIKEIRNFHTTPKLKTRFNPYAEIDKLLISCLSNSIDLPADITWARRLIGMTEGLLETGILVPSRNDGSSSNLMINSEGKVFLIDFDRAGMNDPLYDIGCLLAEMTDHERNMRVTFEYLSDDFDEVAFCRARLWSYVDDFLHALWAFHMAHNSERKSIEWIKYGEWRYLRLRMALSNSLFEEKVRIANGGTC